MRIGLLILVASFVGFSISQLYVAWLLDVYALQIPEYIKQKVDSPCIVLEVKHEKPSPMMSDVIFMFINVDRFADVASRLCKGESLCENGACKVVLHLLDGHYYIENRVAGSEWSYLIGFDIIRSATFLFPGQLLSFLGLVFGTVLGLCLVWKAKSLDTQPKNHKASL